MSTRHPLRVSTRSTAPDLGRKILVVKQSHALAALIDDVRSANGWSDPDVVARAASKGHKLSKSNISRIRNNPVVTLNIDTVSALADGLGVSRAMVAQAALASMGIVTYNSADLSIEEAIRRDPTLGERDKRTLLAVLAGLRGEPGNSGQESNRNGGNSAQELSNQPSHEIDRERSDLGVGQKTDNVPDGIPTGMGAMAARITIVITELRKRYGQKHGELPEDWRESIIESGLWEDAAIPFLTGELGGTVMKSQFLRRLIEELQKTQKTKVSTAPSSLAAKRQAGKALHERRSRERPTSAHPDNNIPLPEDYERLAAHPFTESSGRREYEEARERGEESQEDRRG